MKNISLYAKIVAKRILTLHVLLDYTYLIKKKVERRLSMTDNEILLAMTKIIQPLRDDIQEIKQDVRELKSDMKEVKQRLDVLEDDSKAAKKDIRKLQKDVRDLQNGVQEVNTRVTRIEILQENETLPRLENIESCYISTFERYQVGSEQIDTMQMDIDIMKKVITEHSSQLQKIS